MMVTGAADELGGPVGMRADRRRRQQYPSHIEHRQRQDDKTEIRPAQLAKGEKNPLFPVFQRRVLLITPRRGLIFKFGPCIFAFRYSESTNSRLFF